MPRFFFDFQQAGQREADSAGVELADTEQAYLEVFRAAQGMWSELLKQRRDPRRCSFEVRNEEGDSLFTFPFQEVLDCCSDRLRTPVGDTFMEVIRTSAYAVRVREEMRREIEAAHQVLNASRKLLKQVSDF